MTAKLLTVLGFVLVTAVLYLAKEIFDSTGVGRSFQFPAVSRGVVVGKGAT